MMLITNGPLYTHLAFWLACNNRKLQAENIYLITTRHFVYTHVVLASW